MHEWMDLYAFLSFKATHPPIPPTHSLFPHNSLHSLEELTLSASQPKANLRHRLTWQSTDGQEMGGWVDGHKDGEGGGGGGGGGRRLVTLGPMEIRMWEVVVGWKGWDGWVEERGLMEMM